MLSIPHMLIEIGPDGRANYAAAMLSYSTIEDYIRCSGMERDGTWVLLLRWFVLLISLPVMMYDRARKRQLPSPAIDLSLR